MRLFCVFCLADSVAIGRTYLQRSLFKSQHAFLEITVGGRIAEPDLDQRVAEILAFDQSESFTVLLDDRATAGQVVQGIYVAAPGAVREQRIKGIDTLLQRICSCTVNGGMYWQSYATAKKLDEYMPVDMYIAGCMPRPEAVITGLRALMANIEAGKADAWKQYYQNYDYYLGNQQHLFGNNWQTPTDVIGEAEHYRLMGPNTLGEHTKILQQVQQPLEAMEMKL